MDTGTSDLWVYSTLTKHTDSKPINSERVIFDPTKSKSWRYSSERSLFSIFARREKLKWATEHGDGWRASGIIGFDDVKIGDVKISKQAVQLMTSQLSDIQAMTADGVLGLALGHVNSGRPTAVETPLESMINQNLLSEQLFTVNLGNDPFMSFGFVDEAVCGGRDIHWVDVDPVKWGYWSFATGVVRVGDKCFKRQKGFAIADTGSTFLLTHPYIVWMVYKEIQGASYDPRQPGWVYPSGADIPEIAFSVGKDDTCMVVINDKNMAAFDLGGPEGYFFGAIQENPAYESDQIAMDIFGYPFLRHVYSIFDIQNSRFGVVILEEDNLMTSFTTDKQNQDKGSGSLSTNANNADLRLITHNSK